jgi:hypothetical protein
MMKSDAQSFRELLPLPSGKLVLPLSSGKPIMPHVTTRIVGSPTREALTFASLIISNAGTAGGTRDWVINDIEVDGMSQLEVKGLSGVLFSTRGIVARDRQASSCLYIVGGGKYPSARLYFRGIVIERESEVAVTVTYVGSNPFGCPLFASIIGDVPPQRPTVLPIMTKNKLLHGAATTIAIALDQSLEIGMLEIDDTGTNGGDWIVNDIRVDGTSQFTKPGNIPGDLFATGAIVSFVKFYPGTQIELLVTYIGLNNSGSSFAARLLGTVVRDDLQHPPPDVRAVIGTSGQGDTEVVGRCAWRAP